MVLKETFYVGNRVINMVFNDGFDDLKLMTLEFKITKWINSMRAFYIKLQ